MKITGVILATVLGYILYLFIKNERMRQLEARLTLNRKLAQDRLESEFLRKSQPSAAQIAQATTFEEQPIYLSVFR